MDINWMGWIGVGSPRYNSKSNTIGLQISPCKELSDTVYTDTYTDTVYKFHLAKSSQTIGLQISPCKELTDTDTDTDNWFANFTLQKAPRQNYAQVRLLPRSSVSSHPRRATIKFHPYAVVSMFKNHSECCRTNDDDYIFIIYHAMIRYLSELTPPSGYD